MKFCLHVQLLTFYCMFLSTISRKIEAKVKILWKSILPPPERIEANQFWNSGFNANEVWVISLLTEHLQLQKNHLRIYIILYEGKMNFALATTLLHLSDF